MSPRRSAPFNLEYILLGFLSQRAMHGYDLYKTLVQGSGVGLVWRVKQSQLYALLDKLEAGQLLESELVPGEAHLQRKQYRLTERGRMELDEWMRSPVQHAREMRQEFLARLYFAHLAGEETEQQLLRAQAEACRGWLVGIQQRLQALRPEQTYEKMIFQYRIAQMRAMLSWLEER